MKKFTVSALAALTAVVALAPATSTPADARNRGAKVAVGVLAGAAALAIIANSNSARASNYGHRRGHRGYDDGGFARTCNKWYRQCDNGNNYACEKFETRGCTE